MHDDCFAIRLQMQPMRHKGSFGYCHWSRSFDSPINGSVANSLMCSHDPFLRESIMGDGSFKGRHFQKEMILQSIRGYLPYSPSYRDIEALMEERGFSVEHSTINRWVLHDSPQLEAAFRRKKKCSGDRWRAETIESKPQHTYANPPGQIPDQHHRARPPTHQEKNAPDAGLQNTFLRPSVP